MAQDLFNNISNDYIYPDLPPCPGAGGDDHTFEFLPRQQVGIVSGADVILSMGLDDLSQAVMGWTQECKILQPGEVIFVQGLTKGISKRKQFFPFTGDVEYTGANHPFYMSVDISLNFYKNFKHYDLNVFATSNAINGIDIATAFNMKFDDLDINIDVTYETSGLTFEAKNVGYLFDVEHVDVSLWEPDSSIKYETLYEDVSTGIPAFKYPNTGMLGYVLKATYPNSAPEHQSYIEINHVPDYLEWFELVDDASIDGCYTRHYDAVDVGLNKACYGSNIMSAGDYLNYVDTHDKWDKVGPIRIWLTVPDPVNSMIENLITGFYVYNPQSFAIKICYMIII